MTDNEIKKALEWLEKLKRDTDVSEWAESLKIILNEYNRQKQEIERLKKSVKEAVSCFTRMESLYKIKCKELEVAKSETIKEFAKRFEYFILNEDVEIVKPKCKYYGSYINGANQFRHQIKNGINNLVKEMTEEKEKWWY